VSAAQMVIHVLKGHDFREMRKNSNVL